MRILVVTNLYPPDVIGGYELGCRQAVDALRDRGHDVRVLTSTPRQPVATHQEDHVLRRLRLAEVWSDYLFRKRLPVNSYLEQSRANRIDAHNVHVLLEEIEGFKPDVVYPWMLVGLGGLGLMGCLSYMGVPWVWHLMDDVPVLLCKMGDAPHPVLVREFNRHLRGRYIACSRQLADEIEQSGIELRDEVRVLPNWVTGGFEPAREHYLEGGILRIVTAAGRIQTRGDKGLDLLVDCARALLDGGRDRFTMDFYGTVGDASIPELIQSRGVGDHVRLLGPRTQSELSGLYAGYDIFAFPTRTREPFGFAPLEAAAMGCVPIVSQVCGIAEWLVHGVHVLKAARRVDAFASLLAEVMDGKVDLAGLGRRCAGVVRRDFHLDKVIKEIEATLTSAAAQRPKRLGSASDAYRMALLAERLTQVLFQEPLCA